MTGNRFAVILDDPRNESDEIEEEHYLLLLWERGKPGTTTVHLRGAGYGELHFYGQDMVMWGSGSGAGDGEGGQYALDLRTRTIHQLGENEGVSAVDVCGDYFVYTTARAKENGPMNHILARWTP